MIGALITAFEIAPAFVGGIRVTIPSMLLLHGIIGIGEGAITTVLITSIQRLNLTSINSRSLLKRREPCKKYLFSDFC